MELDGSGRVESKIQKTAADAGSTSHDIRNIENLN